MLKCFLFQISKTYRYIGVEDNLCGQAQHVCYYIHYFSNQLWASSDRGDNPDPKRLSILFKSRSLNGRSKMGTDSLGLSSWTLRQKFGFQFPAALRWPQCPILELFHPLSKTKLCLSFPTWQHPASNWGQWGSRAWTYATWGSLHRQSLFQSPLLGWLGLSQICIKVLRLFPHMPASSSFYFFPGASPHPPTNSPPKKTLCPPTSVSAWVSQRVQLMQVKNQL